MRIAALLHDIGKIGIAESILNKNGVLNEDEREEMQKHPYIGAKILSEVKEFYEGVNFECEKWGCEIIGGDTVGAKIFIVNICIYNCIVI